MKVKLFRILPPICRVPVLLLLLGLSFAGCREAPRKEYDLKGKVVSVNADGKQVTLEHEDDAL